MERRGTSRERSKVALLPHLSAIAAPVELAVAIAFLCAFASLVGNVTGKRAFLFDLPAMQAIHHLESSWLTIAMQVDTASASVLGATVLALVLCISWWGQVGR